MTLIKRGNPELDLSVSGVFPITAISRDYGDYGDLLQISVISEISGQIPAFS